MVLRWLENIYFWKMLPCARYYLLGLLNSPLLSTVIRCGNRSLLSTDVKEEAAGLMSLARWASFLSVRECWVGHELDHPSLLPVDPARFLYQHHPHRIKQESQWWTQYK